jgi:hypothetical protein
LSHTFSPKITFFNLKSYKALPLNFTTIHKSKKLIFQRIRLLRILIIMEKTPISLLQEPIHIYSALSSLGIQYNSSKVSGVGVKIFSKLSCDFTLQDT